MGQLYTSVEDRPEAMNLIEAAEVLIGKAEKYQVIETDADAAVIGEFRARVNQHIKDLDKERLEMGDGLRSTLDKINAKFNESIRRLREKLDRADYLLRKYLADKRAREEAERREAERKAREEQERRDVEQRAAEEEAAKLGIEPPPPLPVVVEALPAVSSGLTGSFGSRVGTRENWKYRITNIKKVPETYLVPVEDRVNKSVLNALARSQKDKAAVPGIEFYNEESIQSRVVS